MASVLYLQKKDVYSKEVITKKLATSILFTPTGLLDIFKNLSVVFG